MHGKANPYSNLSEVHRTPTCFGQIFCHKIHDQNSRPTHPTLKSSRDKKKIDKRGRKLVDYDSQRHQLENLQRSNRRDEYKIARVKDQLENARSTYETLNKELYDELPSIYDQRIPNTANSLQTLFAAEGTFMQESSKISKELDLIAEKLGKECVKGTYNTKRGSPPRAPKAITITTEGSPQSPRTQNSPTVWYEVTDADASSSLNSKSLPSASPKDAVENSTSIKEEKMGDDITKEGELNNVKNDDIEKTGERIHINNSNNNIDTDEMFEEILKDDDDDDDENRISKTPPRTPPPPVLPQASPPPPPDSPTINTEPPIETPRKNKDENRPTISAPVVGGREETGRPYEEIEFEDKKVNGTSAPKVNGEVVGTPVPPGATTDGLPPGVLYRVKATYKYVREDVDELGFDVGEIIHVVEYEDPEEQEEGWLCGMKESTQEKGLFPANFTRPL
ncbi:Bridging integrator 2 [Armadillidium vulgare]|nr:Bridging integrator 2 [Armadillidium vulgare]